MGLRLLLIEESYQTWSTTAPVTKWLAIFTNLWISWASISGPVEGKHGKCSYNGVLPRKLLSDLCQSAPAPLCSGSSSGQPRACRSAHKPRSTSGVHPLHKCWVWGFGETSHMQHQHKKKTSCSAVTPLDGTPEDMERRLPLSSHSRLGARTPPSDTKAALPLPAGLFPPPFCLFASRHCLDATQFPSLSSELDPAKWKKKPFMLK